MILRWTAILFLALTVAAPGTVRAAGLSEGEVDKLLQVPAGRLLVHTLAEAEAALVPLQGLSSEEALGESRDEYLEHLGALRASIRSLALVCMLAFPEGPASASCPVVIRRMVDACRPLASDSEGHDAHTVAQVLSQVNDLSILLDEMGQSLRRPSSISKVAGKAVIELHGAD